MACIAVVLPFPPSFSSPPPPPRSARSDIVIAARYWWKTACCRLRRICRIFATDSFDVRACVCVCVHSTVPLEASTRIPTPSVHRVRSIPCLLLIVVVHFPSSNGVIRLHSFCVLCHSVTCADPGASTSTSTSRRAVVRAWHVRCLLLPRDRCSAKAMAMAVVIPALVLRGFSPSLGGQQTLLRSHLFLHLVRVTVSPRSSNHPPFAILSSSFPVIDIIVPLHSFLCVCPTPHRMVQFTNRLSIFIRAAPSFLVRDLNTPSPSSVENGLFFTSPHHSFFRSISHSISINQV
ncbi:hypothetical protein BJ912DRAFT_118988 [Pholiota molesta]|nr:hypothetical protein BJ912DRAFT_118988 [Pholiota molesta]